MALKVYVDRMSQPSRALLIFCKVNEIDFEEITINLAKRQHRTPEFKEINPFGQVPAIVDGRFKLFESHAILTYLAFAFPGVADHWYPSDLSRRAKINSVLDWHHSNLRRGADPYILNTILAPALCLPLNPQAAAEAEKILTKSLSDIESIWLKGKGRFLLGGIQPSIADLSLVCEIMQLERGWEYEMSIYGQFLKNILGAAVTYSRLLDEMDRTRILGPHKIVQQWIEDTRKATNPHFDHVHEVLFKAKARLQPKHSTGENKETENNNKAFPSKL